MEFEGRIPKLVAKHLRGDLTTSEQKILDDWINNSESNKLFFAESTNEKLLAEELRHFNKIDTTSRLSNALETINPETKAGNKSREVQMKRYMTTTCAIVIAGIAICILLNRASNKKDVADTTINSNYSFKDDVAPGTEKATLTLANGLTIKLNNLGNKKIADENGTDVSKQGAQLVHDASQLSSTSQSKLSFHLVSTPGGGQYQFALSDGSRVWLNAVSSIRFPTVFIGKERNVEITGEAYFEVTPDPARPFNVKINTPFGNGRELQLLGPHFNVNAYADEVAVNSTFLESKIKGSKNSSAGLNSGAVLLKPGLQAQLIQGKLNLVENADIDAVLVRKNSLLSFNAASIKPVMQQISRWYDVDVMYAGDVKETFFVKMNRHTNVPIVFKILETTGGVHFEIDGRRITVRPKVLWLI